MKKPTALLLSLMIASTFTACAGKDTAKPEDSSASQGGETASSEAAEIPDSSDDNSEAVEDPADEVMERFGYNSTFDDEVFETIASNIVIGDDAIYMPFNLSDLNDNFSYDKTLSNLYYKDYIIAQAIREYQNDNAIEVLYFFKSDLDKAHENGANFDLSVGGMEYGDSIDTILKYFGEPDQILSEAERNVELICYKTFDSDEKDKYVLWITFQDGLVKEFEIHC